MIYFENPNEERVNRFADVLETYDTDDTACEKLIDLLTDARHWCDSYGKSYAELDRLAYQHYVVEAVEARRES